jgi:hypothetical protein
MTSSYLMGMVIGAVLFASSAAGSRAATRRLFSWGLVLIGAGAASLLPLVPVAEFAAPRTFFILSVFTCWGAVLVGYAMCLDVAARRRLSTGNAPNFKVLRLTGLAMLSVYLLQVSNEIRLANALQRGDSARSRDLASIQNKGLLVQVAPFDAPLPTTVHHADVGPDPDGWINQAVAREFGLAAIRLQDQAEPREPA